MMFVATDPDAEPYDPAADNAEEWAGKHDTSGKRVMGNRLQPVEAATTVRRRAGKILVTDGPFAETREWIAGFDILDCADSTRRSRSRRSTRWPASGGWSCGRSGPASSRPAEPSGDS
jgi:hypothetical protein